VRVVEIQKKFDWLLVRILKILWMKGQIESKSKLIYGLIKTIFAHSFNCIILRYRMRTNPWDENKIISILKFMFAQFFTNQMDFMICIWFDHGIKHLSRWAFLKSENGTKPHHQLDCTILSFS